VTISELGKAKTAAATVIITAMPATTPKIFLSIQIAKEKKVKKL
jgi:hypothetical protein